MKKDIQIPEVKDVHVAAVQQTNKQGDNAWYVHLINNKTVPLENIMITTRGYVFEDGKEQFVSSTMRHKMAVLPAKSAAKIELIDPQVFEIFNEYWVTFFCENQLLERKFTFGPHTIDAEFLAPIPVLPMPGIIVS